MVDNFMRDFFKFLGLAATTMVVIEVVRPGSAAPNLVTALFGGGATVLKAAGGR